jgi:meiotic recombination protein SPO11
MYYRDPALFSKQAVVDRFVDDLAFTFGVPRLLLNVVGVIIAYAVAIRDLTIP